MSFSYGQVASDAGGGSGLSCPLADRHIGLNG